MDLKKKPQKKQIVFFCSSPPAVMIYKIAKELHKNNYETVLLLMSNTDRFDYDFFKPAFDKIICSNFQFIRPDIMSPKYLLKRLPGFISFLIKMKMMKPYLVISCAGANWHTKFAHKYFFKKYPFIYFPYDINSHYFSSRENALQNNKKEFEIDAEKYCFENLDGIIHKGAPEELEPLNGRIFDKINFTELQLNFLPYASNEFIIPINKNKLSKKDKELHFVYIGGLYYGGIMGKIHDFLRETAKQKIHTHMYLYNQHISKQKDKQEINNAFKDFINKPYFHLHNTMGPKEIIQEISKYDFGIVFAYTTGVDYIEPIYCSGNKLASFIEAGIPYVCDDKLKFNKRIGDKYNIVFSFNDKTLKDLAKRLKKLGMKKINENMKNAREDFLMEKHMPRLIEFIEKVVKKKNENK